MTTRLIDALRQARAELDATTVEPGEAAVARRLQRELDEAIGQLAGADAQKDLVSIVCHDLKDPLASIVMGAGFLRKTIATDDGASRRVVDAICRSANRMSQVVSDFHDLAKLEAGTLALDCRSCDVVAALRAVVAALEVEAQERRLSLTMEASAPTMLAKCDRMRLMQIVSKLLSNALRFTPPEGRVVLRLADEDGLVRISVTDTGRGIPAEQLCSVFDYGANARRSPRDGPGLGLPIVRGLVELHSGKVAVESRVGEGSTFAFMLPRA